MLAAWLVINAMPREGGTVGRGVVVLLYRWARYWRAVACAADDAVLVYHLTMRETAIEPECCATEAPRPQPVA